MFGFDVLGSGYGGLEAAIDIMGDVREGGDVVVVRLVGGAGEGDWRGEPGVVRIVGGVDEGGKGREVVVVRLVSGLRGGDWSGEPGV